MALNFLSIFNVPISVNIFIFTPISPMQTFCKIVHFLAKTFITSFHEFLQINVAALKSTQVWVEPRGGVREQFPPNSGSIRTPSCSHSTFSSFLPFLPPLFSKTSLYSPCVKLYLSIIFKPIFNTFLLIQPTTCPSVIPLLSPALFTNCPIFLLF